MNQKSYNRHRYISWLLGYPFIQPDILQIDLTHRCNLNCKMCNVKRYPARKEDELSKEEICDLIIQAKELGVKTLILAGGEPLLRKDIFDICTCASRTGLSPVIVSNGTLIEERLAQDILAHLNGSICISLDGTETVHDSLRGQGTFKETVDGIRRITRLRGLAEGRIDTLKVNVGLVITKLNYKELPNMVRLAAELGVDGLYFVPLLRDNTDLTDNASTDNLWLTFSQIDELRGILNSVKRIARENGVNFEEKIPNELIVRYYRKQLEGRDWFCLGGVKNIFITLCNPEQTQGYQPYVRICMDFVGNVRKKKLKEIWFSLRAFRARQKIKYCRTPCLQPCFPGFVPTSKQRIVSRLFKWI